MLGSAKSQRKENTEASQQEKLGQLLEVFYHEWKTLARCKGAEASLVRVRDTQAGAEGNREDSEYEKMHALPASNSVKPNSGCADVARFGEASLEAARNFLEDNKVID